MVITNNRMIGQNLCGNFWPLVLQSPVVLFFIGVIYAIGYNIAFLLFGYRKEVVREWKGLYYVFGLGFTAFVFLIVNFGKIFSKDSPITAEDIMELTPQTLLLSLAILFVVTIMVVFLRDRRSGG